jgi:predicted metal-dependent HD superfamily phosphohydrolase
MLENVFIKLVRRYTDEQHLANELWNELVKDYSSPQRYYHTLEHLEHLLTQLAEIDTLLHDRDTVLFTLYYHDIVYNPLKSDNEEKSAARAAKRMQQLSIPAQKIALCQAQILATKSHQHASDSDTNYFTDADLSILGQHWETYAAYYKNVRKEYAIYPDFMYNPGRKKVLKHFLAMERIFKTDFFFQKYEQQARQNILQELTTLE